MTKERRERSETRASEGGDRNNVECLSGNARPSPTIISAWRSLFRRWKRFGINKKSADRLRGSPVRVLS